MQYTHAVGIMVVLMLNLSAIPAIVRAQESNGTPAARRLLAEGEAAAKSGEHAAASAAFRKAIDADPEFVEAHQRFIESTRREQTGAGRSASTSALHTLYARWATAHPRRAVYPWALGFLAEEPAEADVVFRKAIELDPRFARAHFSLARNADLRGDWDAQRRHLQAAVESNPDDPQYLVKYAHAHRTGDPARFRELALQVVEKFPESASAAEALYHLAGESEQPERRTYFERLRANYPPDRFSYASLAMSYYYDDLIAPAEALALAQDVVKWLPSNRAWAQRVAHQTVMTRAEALIAERNYARALQAIEQTKRPSGTHRTTWVLMKAEAAAGAGQTEQAYKALLESVAVTPDERLQTALVKYGSAVKKTLEDVEEDVWRLRDGNAVPAAPFVLTNSRNGEPVELSDYAGRVVLLAFWFPG